MAVNNKAHISEAEKDLDQMFYNIFAGNSDGEKIFMDLSHKFYDRTSVVGSPVDVSATLVREGERNVVLYIMGRLSRLQAGQ
jgi:hypothetical protein